MDTADFIEAIEKGESPKITKTMVNNMQPWEITFLIDNDFEDYFTDAAWELSEKIMGDRMDDLEDMHEWAAEHGHGFYG